MSIRTPRIDPDEMGQIAWAREVYFSDAPKIVVAAAFNFVVCCMAGRLDPSIYKTGER